MTLSFNGVDSKYLRERYKSLNMARAEVLKQRAGVLATDVAGAAKLREILVTFMSEMCDIELELSARGEIKYITLPDGSVQTQIAE